MQSFYIPLHITKSNSYNFTIKSFSQCHHTPSNYFKYANRLQHNSICLIFFFDINFPLQFLLHFNKILIFRVFIYYNFIHFLGCVKSFV